MGLSLNVDQWNKGGGGGALAYPDGSAIPGVAALQTSFGLVSRRECQVQWKVAHVMQPHERFTELLEVLRVGPPAPPSGRMVAMTICL